ncbi:peptidylprolyl isomerase [Halobacteriales archaeon QS_3_64_16]|nr:MAG: peptidylprolyl isomerase [Halobacteriales archaeon QS_3_64_16]
MSGNEGTDAPNEEVVSDAEDDDSEPDTPAETDADAEATARDESESGSESEGLSEDDFVRLAYTARTVDGGQLVDTTSQEVAEEEGVDEEDQEFEPRVITLGAGHIFEDVEEDIMGSEVGDSGSVTVAAVDAFGEYDQEEVRTISAEKIPEDDRYPGAHVDLEGEHGHVETIIGGRARVDFNHVLAGEDIEYDYEIEDVVEDRTERAQGLLGMFIGDADFDLWIETDEEEEETVIAPDEEEIDENTPAEELPEPETEVEVVEKETLYLEAPPQLQFDQQWMFQKNQIAEQLMDQLDLDRVIVQETIDGSGGMFGGMGGMMGGMGGGGGEELEELEEELADADVDADEIVEELDAEGETE